MFDTYFAKGLKIIGNKISVRCQYQLSDISMYRILNSY